MSGAAPDSYSQHVIKSFILSSMLFSSSYFLIYFPIKYKLSCSLWILVICYQMGTMCSGVSLWRSWNMPLRPDIAVQQNCASKTLCLLWVAIVLGLLYPIPGQCPVHFLPGTWVERKILALISCVLLAPALFLNLFFCFLPRFFLSWFKDSHFLFSLTVYSFIYLKGKNRKQTKVENTCFLMREKLVWCFPSHHLVMRYHYLRIWHDNPKWE